MRFVIAFGFCALLLIILATDLARQTSGGWWLLVALELYLALCFATIAVIYGIREAGFHVEGVLIGSKWSPRIRPIVAPYLALGATTLYLYRWLHPERALDLIAPGIFIGRLPFPSERDQLHAAGLGAILNLSWEFPRLSGLHRDPRYKTLNVPILDGSPPTPRQFQESVEWISRCRSEGQSILVHCAQGHGRSASIVAASLMNLGLASDIEQALAMVTKARPMAMPSHTQKLALSSYCSVKV